MYEQPEEEVHKQREGGEENGFWMMRILAIIQKGNGCV